MALNKNEFGQLVKAYRKQRGWTQEELAERWGHSRGYIAQVEAGRRKLDRYDQVSRLADILGIPIQKLEAIGRGIPERKVTAHGPSEADNALLHMFLAPSKEMVQLSWITWFADAAPFMEDHLSNLIVNLDQALTSYHGEFVEPAQQLLAYAHQMMGKMAFDRLDYAAAAGHFDEMHDLGEELGDNDIVASALVHKGDVFRKRGRFQNAVKCFELAGPYADTAAPGIQGMRYQIMTRAFSVHGEEDKFRRAMDSALEIAETITDSIDNLANQFNLIECLQEQAQGFTMLWQPERALEIYKETDRLRPSRTLRDLGSYSIVKAQAFAYAGILIKGLSMP